MARHRQEREEGDLEEHARRDHAPGFPGGNGVRAQERAERDHADEREKDFLRTPPPDGERGQDEAGEDDGQAVKRSDHWESLSPDGRRE